MLHTITALLLSSYMPFCYRAVFVLSSGKLFFKPFVCPLMLQFNCIQWCFISDALRAGLTVVPVVPWEGAPDQLPNFTTLFCLNDDD